MDASVANPENGGSFHASVGSANLTGEIAVPATGGWTTYTTAVSGSFFLAAGTGPAYRDGHRRE